MQIYGKTIDVEFDVAVPKKDGGSYEGTTITYKDQQGKIQSKAWAKKSLDHPSNAHLKSQLQVLTKGSDFVAEAVKNDAGFWNWVDIKLGAAPANTAPSAPAKSNSTYATPEERAERFALDKAKFEFEKEKQGLIIKQSSLSNAIAHLGVACEPPVTAARVIEIAKIFEAYVLGAE